MTANPRELQQGILILGAGKVGTGLAKALRRAKIRCTLRRGRAALPSQALEASVLVLAVRDNALGPLVQQLRERALVRASTVVVHVAGALTADVLAELRPLCAGVAQMHPMISFADWRFPPELKRGHVHVQGDLEAVRRARILVRKIGMTPRTFPHLDTVAYHAAAGLVANGAISLAAAGTTLLQRAQVPAAAIPKMLGPLLRSVADNVEALGLPAALTGPVRRGDPKAVQRHLATIRTLAPELVPLYLAMAQAQLPLARLLGDAPASGFDQIAQELAQPPGVPL